MSFQCMWQLQGTLSNSCSTDTGLQSFIQSSWWNTSGVHQILHFLKCLRKKNPGSRGSSSRDEVPAVTRGREGQECRDKTACKTFWSAHFCMSKPKRSSSQPSGCYLTVSMSNKATKHFHLPSLCLPIFIFCCRPLDMCWGDNSWEGVGKCWYLECSITSKTCYFTVRGNS